MVRASDLRTEGHGFDCRRGLRVFSFYKSLKFSMIFLYWFYPCLYPCTHLISVQAKQGMSLVFERIKWRGTHLSPSAAGCLATFKVKHLSRKIPSQTYDIYAVFTLSLHGTICNSIVLDLRSHGATPDRNCVVLKIQRCQK